MKIFTCPDCGSPVSFPNQACGCGAALAFDDSSMMMVKAETTCTNRDLIDCNWVAHAQGMLCRACDMTEVTPDTFMGDNLALWADAERAKRWVLTGLIRWGWLGADDPGPLPRFHLLSEQSWTGPVKISMGHLNGVVTINVVEADAVKSAARREALDERFRTLIGHFRHEIAHFLFERLANERAGFLDSFRPMFGDERADYAEALQRHYASGPSFDWAQWHVTPYAASHPHEDWAESAAHVMHLADIVDSFSAAGLSSPSLPAPDYDAFEENSAERLISLGAELGIALNHVNRSMGLPDIYPFVLTPVIRSKLALAHEWLADTSAGREWLADTSAGR